ncbi:hypothetical protein [Ensifer sp. BR816]|uniref:hypothetical protein n=1 Tax=Rhizobium sp. (strain BR816) TaxID=1057002 RepID=UPI0003AA2B94|nr:hypothetical protein [Ensifer sp. BR816]
MAMFSAQAVNAAASSAPAGDDCTSNWYDIVFLKQQRSKSGTSFGGFLVTHGISAQIFEHFSCAGRLD